MESFSIQMVTGRLTRTSSDMSQTSPAKVESGSWLTWTSPDKGWTSLDNLAGIIWMTQTYSDGSG
jgi:hypothetical protein